MTKLTILLITAACLTGSAQAAAPVLSVDTNRILTLARQAIADARDDVDTDKIEFVDISYRFDAKSEHLRVAFRHSPEAEVAGDKEKASVRTVTNFKAITVEMDKTGKILSVSAGGSSRQIKIESKITNAAVPRMHPSVFSALLNVAKQHKVSYETKIHSAVKVEMHFTIDAANAENRINSIKQDLEEKLSESGWRVVVQEYRVHEEDKTKRLVVLLVSPKK
jgi:hypothetical protein